MLLLMCGRYRLSRSKELLAEHFDVEPDDDWVPQYNIAPTQNVPVIRQHPEQPKRLGSRMRWAHSTFSNVISALLTIPVLGAGAVNLRISFRPSSVTFLTWFVPANAGFPESSM